MNIKLPKINTNLPLRASDFNLPDNGVVEIPKINADTIIGMTGLPTETPEIPSFDVSEITGNLDNEMEGTLSELENSGLDISEMKETLKNQDYSDCIPDMKQYIPDMRDYIPEIKLPNIPTPKGMKPLQIKLPDFNKFNSYPLADKLPKIDVEKLKSGDFLPDKTIDLSGIKLPDINVPDMEIPKMPNVVEKVESAVKGINFPDGENLMSKFDTAKDKVEKKFPEVQQLEPILGDAYQAGKEKIDEVGDSGTLLTAADKARDALDALNNIDVDAYIQNAMQKYMSKELSNYGVTMPKELTDPTGIAKDTLAGMQNAQNMSDEMKAAFEAQGLGSGSENNALKEYFGDGAIDLLRNNNMKYV